MDEPHAPETLPGMRGWQRAFLLGLGTWLLMSTSAVTLVALGNPVMRAVVGMAWGVILLWVILCGGLMVRFRAPIRDGVRRIPLPWPLKFFAFATLLAFLEEAIATTMTNLAPLFGKRVGEAYITASTNFFDVVFHHSVINFLGMFVCWSLALRRYDFSAFSAFVIFGVSGVFAEVSLGGVQHFAEFGFWIFVYGLMIFLPVYTLPPAAGRGARRPKVYHCVLMVFLPALFVPLFAWIPRVIDPHHPQPTHFPAASPP